MLMRHWNSKHAKLLRRSIVYAFIAKLKLYLEIKDEDMDEINEIYSVHGDCEKWKTFLKRSNMEHQQVLDLQKFITESRSRAFKSAHPLCVHPECFDDKKNCSSDQNEIQQFLEKETNNKQLQTPAIQTLGALSALVGLLGLEARPLLEH
jgi:hypothetical protein